MAKRALNDRIIKALKPAKAGQRDEIADAGMPGMVLRVTEKGTRTFALVARYPGSDNPTRRALGEYPALGLADARDKARRWLALVDKGIDPKIEAERERAAELRRNADTFAAAVEKLVARKLKTQRRGHVVEYIIRKELLPVWGARPITDISHRDIRDLLERVVDRGATSFAHNVLDAINVVFNFAAAQDMIEANPARLLQRSAIIGSKKPRQRVLGDSEIRAFWRAADQLDYPRGPFFKLLLLTGARLDELAGARWREFDLAAKKWTIPAERFKSDAEHVVPLSDDVLAVLATLPRFNSGDFLFSATFGKTRIRGFTKVKRRLDEKMLTILREMAQSRSDDPKAVELVPFVQHDLRRTVRTRLSALKVQDHIAEMVIGHGRKGIARIYDQHRFEDEKRDALTRWAMLLRSIVEPPPANVVELKATKVS